jgi:beta-glucosidase
VADVLFGDASPGGKLPISFPRAIGQLPVYYNHKPSGGRSHWKGNYVEMNTKPLFPFGYGLSYTSFDYADLQIDRQAALANEQVAISIAISNTGSRAGDEVVQLYIHQSHTSVTRPVQELKGFQRISLAAGEKRTVTFQLDLRQLGFYNQAMAYVVEPGTIEVMIGSSSQDIRARGSFTITGPATDIGHDKVFFSRSTVE